MENIIIFKDINGNIAINFKEFSENLKKNIFKGYIYK